MTTRPKTRNLVRWNDDLDKSLLLFITHTCADMGLKIPYDEVARRMGSTFTEGAIQQHISKLRNKMAELNVAPVPAPSKRGNVTNRPSTIYAQKTRPGPQIPQPVASKSQSKPTAQSQRDGELSTGTTTKKPTRRRTTTIKRSESDMEDTGDEFEGASEDEFAGSLNRNGKRGRATRRQSQGESGRKMGRTRADGTSETNTVVHQLANADALYNQQYGGGNVPQYQLATPFFAQNSFDAGNNTLAAQFGAPAQMTQLTQSFGAGEEEEEEESGGQGNDNQLTTPIRAPYSFPLGIDEQISPTSMGHGISSYMNHQGPAVMPNNFGVGAYQIQPPEMMSRPPTFASNSHDNPDFGNYSMGNHSSSFRTPYSSQQMLPPTYPNTTWPIMNDPMSADSSTRNHSMISNSSQGTNIPTVPQTPAATISPGHMSTPQQNFTFDWVNNDFDIQLPEVNQNSEVKLEERDNIEGNLLARLFTGNAPNKDFFNNIFDKESEDFRE